MVKRKVKSKCFKYGIAINDFVIGEKMDIPYAEFFNHLKDCARCREDLSNWQETYAALRTEAYMKNPETQKKMDDLWKKIEKLPEASTVGKPTGWTEPSLYSGLPGVCRRGKIDESQKKFLDEAKKGIFQTSATICQFLHTNGPTPQTELRQKTGAVSKPFYETMGYLTMAEIVIPKPGKGDEPIYALTK